MYAQYAVREACRPTVVSATVRRGNHLLKTKWCGTVYRWIGGERRAVEDGSMRKKKVNKEKKRMIMAMMKKKNYQDRVGGSTRGGEGERETRLEGVLSGVH
jgi:hypothetical protein